MLFRGRSHWDDPNAPACKKDIIIKIKGDRFQNINSSANDVIRNQLAMFSKFA